ncbi:MAG: pyridoxal-phosphate dependent enzyme [Myxococcales bacterium]|nr:pyridoxal-phosphate dependent enzyme [Myxococcales bacterium]
MSEVPVSDPQHLAIQLADVEAAQQRIADFVHHTPLLSCQTLSVLCGCELRLKGEHLQRSGSFKIRGALNRLRQLDAVQKAAGVVAFSSGNHAQGVALAARLCGTRAVIVMPQDVPQVKLAATRGYGAEVVLYDRLHEDREAIAQRIAQERGAVLVPPFDDPHIMAGQGTIGLEILADWPAVEVLVIPIGGGGLIAGIATAVKALAPHVKVIGVEPEVADDALRSRQAGQIVRIAQPQTLADGVATQAVGQLTFPVMQALVDDIVTVPESAIAESLLLILSRAKQVVEPTAALAVAALVSGRLRLPSRKVVGLLCGGNLDLATLPRLQEIAAFR